MSNWTDLFRGKVIGSIHAKKKAHAFTILSISWMLFSLIALVALKDLAGLAAYIVGATVWGLHLLFIYIAWHYWRTEPKSEIFIREQND